MKCFGRRSLEQKARDYCRAWGIDPDEIVVGHEGSRFPLVRKARWRFYVGTPDDAASRPVESPSARRAQ